MHNHTLGTPALPLPHLPFSLEKRIIIIIIKLVYLWS